MALGTTSARAAYTGNGAASSYSFPWKILAKADMVVTVLDTADDEAEEQTLVLNTDYTIADAGVNNAAGGSIVLVNSAQDWMTVGGNLATDWKIVLRRVRSLVQDTSIRNNGDYYASTHETTFDKLVMIDQQQQEQVDRAVKLPVSLASSDFDPTLPVDITSVPNGGRFIGSNDAGDALEMGPSFNEVFGAAEDAAAAAAAAAASQTAAALSEGNAASSATAAGTSATNAATSAAAAATSATNAATSATNAATAQAGAETAQAAAEAAASDATGAQDAAEDAQAAAEQAQADAEAALAAATAAQTAAEAAQAAAEAAAALAALNSSDTYALQTVNDGGNINHTALGRQFRPIVGNAGPVTVDNTPCGIDPTNFNDGMELTLVGTDDTDYVRLEPDDVQYGLLDPVGPVNITRGVVYIMRYSEELERFVGSRENL